MIYHVDFQGDGCFCFARADTLDEAVELAKSLGDSFITIQLFEVTVLQKSKGDVMKLVQEFDQQGAPTSKLAQ